MKIIQIIISLIFMSLAAHSQDNQDWSGYIELYNEKNVNSENIEFGSAYWNDQIVYVTTNPRQKLIDKNTKEAYFDLYFSELNQVKSLIKGKPLSTVINSDYHEGPASFSQDGSRIFFTRVNYTKGEFTLNEDKSVALKIFESTFVNGTWTDPILASYNLENVASTHPALGHDESYIIFASD